MDAAPSAGRVGRFEGLRGGRWVGWAYDPAAPGPATVRLVAGGRVRLALADRHRADVQKAGFGDGCCGFSLAAFGDGEAFTCTWADDGRPLPGTPAPLPAARTRVRRRSGLTLALDPASPGAGAITGYAIDRADPLRRVELAASVGGERGAPVRACLHRSDAEGEGRDGFHGFSLQRPSTADLRRGAWLVEAPSGRRLARLRSGRA